MREEPMKREGTLGEKVGEGSGDREEAREREGDMGRWRG